MAVRAFLRVTVIVLTVMFHNGIESVTAAQWYVSPLWNDFTNDSQCQFEDTNQQQAVFVLHGSAHQTCSIQVNTSLGYYAHMKIPSRNVSKEPFFLYMERQGDLIHCKDKFVAFTRPDEECVTVLSQDNLRVSLQGNVSILVSVKPALEVQSVCPEDNGDALLSSNINQTPVCNNGKSYSNLITCDLGSNCRIRFPPRCNVTIRNREAFLQCYDNGVVQEHESLIIYPMQLSVLYLSRSKIIEFDINYRPIQEPFANTTDIDLGSNEYNFYGNLVRLYLHGNHIASLKERTFHGLNRLNILTLHNNELTELPSNLFKGLSNLVDLLLLGNQITALNESIFNELNSLQFLALNDNELTTLPGRLFRGLSNLVQLYLGGNRIAALNESLFNSFDGMIYLEYLILSFNQLRSLSSVIFYGLRSLKDLDLSYNLLTHIPADIFKDISAITKIDLSNNELMECPNMKHLTRLQFLNVKGNLMTGIHHDTFSDLPNNSVLVVSQHEICECYVPAGVTCSASDSRSPYLTCDRLLSDRILVFLMWLVGINALGGNVFVLIWRKYKTKKFKVQDLLLYNLAMSDSLMGLYMIIVASADIYYGEYFPMKSETWRTGITCRVAGSLSIASTELSVLFLMLISIDRFICIKYPYSNNKMGKRSTVVLAVLTWLFSLALGIIPSILAGRNFKFYDNSHVCIGLPLSLTKTYSFDHHNTLTAPSDTLLVGRETFDTQFTGLVNGLYFSTAIFLGLNSICYLIILGCYIEIVRAVTKSAKQSGRTPDMDEQIRLTSKVTAIVATDFMCIFPIIVLGILVQARVIELPPSVYAWSVTFVLPINSAINPYMYTIAEIVSNYRKKKDKESQQTTELQKM